MIEKILCFVADQGQIQGHEDPPDGKGHHRKVEVGHVIGNQEALQYDVGKGHPVIWTDDALQGSFETVDSHSEVLWYQY